MRIAPLAPPYSADVQTQFDQLPQSWQPPFQHFAVLARDPRLLGYRATTWTVPLLASHLREHAGCVVSARTLRRRLHEWGYRPEGES